jgi:hypothetical protein
MAEETKPEYKKQAQEIIDILHDKGWISVKECRATERSVEDLLAYMLQSNFERSVKLASITAAVARLTNKQQGE